jgi:peptidoglycan/LPS O-acetylase OafA/YrhL
MVGFTIVSFVYGIVSVYDSPKFAFYFPLCRFWQMSIGGLIAYHNFNIKNKWIANILSISAVLAIFRTIWYIN